MAVKGKKPLAVGAFPTRAEAEAALAELRRLGFDEDQIGILSPEKVSHPGQDPSTDGAAAGALSGSVIGALAGLAVVAGIIPGIGPAIAGGILGSLLASTAFGAVAGGLIGSLVGLGIPEEEARSFEEEFRAGRTLVTVQTADRYADAVIVFRRCGAVDVARRQPAAAASSQAE